MRSLNALLEPIKKQLKQMASGFSEKPAVKMDDYVLEHFLVYHSLVGSSPENQPSFKNVKADITSAITQGSSVNLSIALKLPPLWWEEKLQSIFSELENTHRSQMLKALLPDNPNQELDPTTDPLQHDDWRVRANAAKMLSFLNIQEATGHIIEALKASSQEQFKIAFGYLALSLGQLQNPAAKEALVPNLHHEEPWFRVDAANALSFWPLSEVQHILSEAMLHRHLFSDYMSVAIARKHPLLNFLSSDNRIYQAAGAEMVLAIIQASQQTYPPEIVFETETHRCWSRLLELCQENPSARNIAAAVALGKWLQDQTLSFDNESIEKLAPELQILEHLLHNPSLRKRLLEQATHLEQDALDSQSEASHVLKLIGHLRLTEAAPIISRLAKADFPLLYEVIETLGQLGDVHTAPHLVALAENLVDIDSRTSSAPSPQPVLEEHPHEARAYWSILKALGALPDGSSLQFLLKAVNDHAADKRQQALASLLSVSASLPLSPDIQRSVTEAVVSRLQDRSIPVKLVALEGIAQLGVIGSLPTVIKLCSSTESSVSSRAFNTLRSLHQQEFKQAVSEQLSQQIKVEFDRYRKERLQQFLDSLNEAFPP